MPDTLPLSRYTVLDLTIARAGPTAVRLLADWGANVIKIEPPPARQPVDRSVTGAATGRTTRTCTATSAGSPSTSSTPRATASSSTWCARADIVVENFRADVKRRLGIEYETLAKTNPRIYPRQHFRLRAGRAV